jgi:hypothetical protein
MKIPCTFDNDFVSLWQHWNHSLSTDLGFRRHFADAIFKKMSGEASGVASGHLYRQDLAKLVSTLLLGTVFNADIFTTYFTSIVVCTCITSRQFVCHIISMTCTYVNICMRAWGCQKYKTT